MSLQSSSNSCLIRSPSPTPAWFSWPFGPTESPRQKVAMAIYGVNSQRKTCFLLHLPNTTTRASEHCRRAFGLWNGARSEGGYEIRSSTSTSLNSKGSFTVCFSCRKSTTISPWGNAVCECPHRPSRSPCRSYLEMSSTKLILRGHWRWSGRIGKVCTVSWRTLRKWNESRLVLEHHYDHQQTGKPLSDGDLRSNVVEPR